MVRTVIGVMGPDTVTEKVTEAAYELGKGIAEAGHVLLTGGRSKGVMDAACRGAKAAGGLTIGVLPTGDLSQASEAVDIPIITGMGSGRNNINVLSSTVVVAVGMGPGTASEVALALKAGKPVVLLASTDEAKAFFQSLAPGKVHAVDTVDSALTHVKSLLA